MGCVKRFLVSCGLAAVLMAGCQTAESPATSAEETGAEKARGKPAKQSAAKEARPSRRLADRAGFARLRHASLDRRGSIRGRARHRRRGEGPRAPAAARGPAAHPGIGIRGDENERCRNRGKGN